MARIPEETLEAVLAATDIVALIEGYFPLKRAGSTWKALCPFHHEKTPSFTVNPTRQSYKCFGCGEGGSAIGFVMAYENLPFPEAVRKLAQRAGIPLIEEAPDPQAEKRRHLQTRLKELQNHAARYFYQLLLDDPQASHARRYLAQRGLRRDIAAEWLLGWSPSDAAPFLQEMKAQGFSGRELVASGLCGLRQENNPRSGLYTRFYDRLMFPIHNDYGDVVGFSARQLRADPRSGKYINTPETPVFKKSSLLFALHRARRHIGKANHALLCEGQLDVIACHQAGLPHAVAGLGTAFTPEHARLLRRYTEEVTICFDGDSAGQTAATKAFQALAQEGLRVSLAQLPNGDDPDSYLRREGVESLRQRLAQAPDFLSARLQQFEATEDLRETTRFLQEMAQLASQLQDDLARDASVQKISTQLRIPPNDLRQRIESLRRKARTSAPPAPRSTPTQPTPTRVESTPLDPNLGYLANLALHSATVRNLIGEQRESLQPVLDTLPGGPLLETILKKAPEEPRPAAISAFLSSLPTADQQALAKRLHSPLPPDEVKAASETIASLLSSHYQRREASLRASLGQKNLSPEELRQTLDTIKELQSLLRNLPARHIR